MLPHTSSISRLREQALLNMIFYTLVHLQIPEISKRRSGGGYPIEEPSQGEAKPTRRDIRHPNR